MDISTNSRSTNGTSTKKRKVEEEKRVFKERWTEDYFFVNNSDKKPLCLICKTKVLVMQKSTMLNDTTQQTLLITINWKEMKENRN